MSREYDPRTRSTPVASWPELDRTAWAVAQEPADPFEPSSGLALRWKASTRKQIQNGYGLWLGWLDRSGLLDPQRSPGQRASRDRVSAYLAMLREVGRADNSVAGRLQQLSNALQVIEPGGDWSWIHRASSRIYSRAAPVRDHVSRMQPAEDVIALGFDLMHEAEHGRFRTPCDRATLYRDGLMVAFLAQRPFRSANLTAITLDRHLQYTGGRWRLFFGDNETKNGEAIACDWPESLVVELERYLAVHREELLKGAPKPAHPTSALWISRRGGPMGAAAVAFQIGDRTREAFGHPINPHAFRHMAATTIATANPEGVTAIKPVLGHTSLNTSEKYYNRAKTLAAGQSLNNTIATLRKDKRP